MWIDDVTDALDAADPSRPRRDPAFPGAVGLGRRPGAPARVAGVVTYALPTSDPAAMAAFVDEVRGHLAVAHPFVFASTPVELAEDGRNFRLPPLTGEEVAFFNEGLVPSPFPSTFLEYERGDGRKIGILAVEGIDPSGTEVVDLWRFARAADGEGRICLDMTGYAIRLVRTGTMPASLPEGIDPGDVDPSILEGIASGGAARVPRERIYTGLVDPFDGHDAQHLLKTVGHAADGVERSADDIAASMRDEAMVFVYLALMLGSTSTTVERAAPRGLSDRRRVAAGLSRTREHHVVHLYPRGIREALASEGGGVAAHRRVHWRRSHSRRLPSGRSVVVARHVVGFRRLDGTTLAPNAYAVSARVVAARRAAASPAGDRGLVVPPATGGETPPAAATGPRPTPAARGNAAFEAALDDILSRG